MQLGHQSVGDTSSERVGPGSGQCSHNGKLHPALLLRLVFALSSRKVPVRKAPGRGSLDGVDETRLADMLVADDDQLDGTVDDRVLLQRAQVLTHVGRALREVRRDVDERVVRERDAAQSTERCYRDWQL